MFLYAPGRGAEHAKNLLRDFCGIVQCDGYGAYKAVATERGLTLAFCWAHVRREFFGLAKGKGPIAEEALRRIAALYAVEAELRGKPPDVRRAVRGNEDAPFDLPP